MESLRVEAVVAANGWPDAYTHDFGMGCSTGTCGYDGQAYYLVVVVSLLLSTA